MRVAFLSLPVPGHLNPMTALARKYQARGHEVVFLSLPDVAPFVQAAQLPFVPCAEDAYPQGSLGKYLPQLSRLSGTEALSYTVNEMMKGYTESLFQSLPETLHKAGADAIVLDQYQPYVELIPKSLGMPYVHISNALHVDYSGRSPLCFYGRRPTGSGDTAKNREDVERFRVLLEPTTEMARRYARKAGLSVDWKNPNSTVSPLLWVTQTPREFDFDRAPDLPQFHYSGPWHDGHGRIPVEFPWERLTGAPIVYVSMGTLQNGIIETFRAIAASAGKLKHLQFVLAIGNQITPEQIGETASNVLTVAYAPQIELLKRSSLCITHAGLNTVLEALSFGVPLLAIPITNDQPGVAARIAHKKVGLVISQEELSSADLPALITQAAEDSTLRANAGHIRESIWKTDGLATAARLIEEAFGLPAHASSREAALAGMQRDLVP
jgi:zeaxanthin glucosyltransferase